MGNTIAAVSFCPWLFSMLNLIVYPPADKIFKSFPKSIDKHPFADI